VIQTLAPDRSDQPFGKAVLHPESIESQHRLAAVCQRLIQAAGCLTLAPAFLSDGLG
jgi:hypothetical protein